LHTFELPLAAEGTPFQHQVWTQLVAIPYGETRTYGQLAHGLGMPTGARAVGSANGSNPLPIVVPCHRVIGSTGKLTGFYGGVHLKQFLLDLERRHARRQRPQTELF
jgi:methylated-DNA-[protein]-cysteine S-methyltransferase